MKDLLDKLSSYNIFNYLLPGIVFVGIADALTDYHFVQKDIVVGLFLYYFIGLVISRIGSIIIEPILKWVKFVRFTSYADFVNASKENKLLEVLSETNNMYRTLCSLFLCLIFLKSFEFTSNCFPFLRNWTGEILVVVLLVLFGFSYRKQTQYISKRVNNAIKRS